MMDETYTFVQKNCEIYIVALLKNKLWILNKDLNFIKKFFKNLLTISINGYILLKVKESQSQKRQKTVEIKEQW